MVPKSRIASPRAQRLAVMVVMTGVFALSMGLAYLTAAVSGVPEVDALGAPETVSLKGLRVKVPGDWQADAVAARELGVDVGRVLRDPQRPHRWLLVTTTRQPRSMAPPEQMARYFEALLGPELHARLEPMMPQRVARRNGLVTLEYVGLSPAVAEPGRRLHLMITASRDGLRHWVVYLTDHIEPGESLTGALQRNLALFRRIEDTIEPEPTEPTEPGQSGESGQ